MKKITFLILTSLLSFNSIAKEKWYGLYTTDSLPVDNCSITDTAGGYTHTSWVQASDKVDKGKAFVDEVITAVMDTEKVYANKVKKGGWNAVVGYSIKVDQIYNGFGTQIINGMKGTGGAVLIAQGVPVEVICK